MNHRCTSVLNIVKLPHPVHKVRRKPCTATPTHHAVLPSTYDATPADRKPTHTQTLTRWRQAHAPNSTPEKAQTTAPVLLYCTKLRSQKKTLNSTYGRGVPHTDLTVSVRPAWQATCSGLQSCVSRSSEGAPRSNKSLRGIITAAKCSVYTPG